MKNNLSGTSTPPSAPQKTKASKVQVKGSKFPYYLEYCPNQDIVQIHARSRFPKSSDMDGLDLQIDSKRKKKRHQLYIALARTKGIKSASSHGYHLTIEKANDLFPWPEILPKLLRLIQTHVAGKRKLVEIGKPKRPSAEMLHSLRMQGCDV